MKLNDNCQYGIVKVSYCHNAFLYQLNVQIKSV